MRRFSPHDTQWLTRASFEPAAERRLRSSVGTIVAALALVAAGAIGFNRLGETLSPLTHRADMAQRNATLVDEVERLRMEIKVERATRGELQRQIDAMSRQIMERDHQLEFLSSRNGQAERGN